MEAPEPKMHWSRLGYTTACGKRLDGTKYLTRNIRKVTCKTCRKAVKEEGLKSGRYAK